MNTRSISQSICLLKRWGRMCFSLCVCVCESEQENSKLIFMPSVHGAELKICGLLVYCDFVCISISSTKHVYKICVTKIKTILHSMYLSLSSLPSDWAHEKQIKTLATWKRDVNVQCLNIYSMCVYIWVYPWAEKSQACEWMNRVFLLKSVSLLWMVWWFSFGKDTLFASVNLIKSIFFRAYVYFFFFYHKSVPNFSCSIHWNRCNPHWFRNQLKHFSHFIFVPFDWFRLTKSVRCIFFFFFFFGTYIFFQNFEWILKKNLK